MNWIRRILRTWDAPEEPTICAACRFSWHTLEGRWWCYIPRHDAVTLDYVTGKRKECSVACEIRNPDGKCPHFRPKPEERILD